MHENIYFQSLVAWPNNELRQEGHVVDSPFGSGSEQIISEVVKELHIHFDKTRVHISLDNPFQGGPVVVCHGSIQEVIVPGEKSSFPRSNFVILAKKINFIHTMIINDHSSDLQNNENSHPI